MVFIIDWNDSQLLFPVWCWLPGSERQAGLSMATIKPSWQCLPLLWHMERILERGECAKRLDFVIEAHWTDAAVDYVFDA